MLHDLHPMSWNDKKKKKNIIYNYIYYSTVFKTIWSF
jgi:hypothetical protein